MFVFIFFFSGVVFDSLHNIIKNMSFLSLLDKSEVTEAEGVVQEEDTLMQDEIFKSRLASIKRVRARFFFLRFALLCNYIICAKIVSRRRKL